MKSVLKDGTASRGQLGAERDRERAKRAVRLYRNRRGYRRVARPALTWVSLSKYKRAA